ncbi:MAG: hypothetical protein K2V38_10545 [Gemmataceae bacterium]|nr:hypothetical protein [Gemmataceae bacterium]
MSARSTLSTGDPLASFREVWCADFEFRSPDGHRPHPLCLVARELLSGRAVRLWLTDGSRSSPPFDVGPEVLFVAY